MRIEVNIDKNFLFERILLFVTKDARITKPLQDATFSCQMGKLSLYVGKKHYWVFEILLSKHSLSQNKYYFNLYEFLKWWIHAFVERLKNRCFCWFWWPYLYPLKGHQHGIFIQKVLQIWVKRFSEYLAHNSLHFYFW